MAYSQVEIPSSSPFGCVLRDHNQRDRCSRESNFRSAQAAFQKNLKDFVRDHFHSCISSSPRNSDSHPNENSLNHQIDNAGAWVGQQQQMNNNDDDDDNNKTKIDGWARAREMMVSSRGTRFQRENSHGQSDCSIGGVSSLVQRWRGFEAEGRLNQSGGSPVYSSRSNSGSSCYAENASFAVDIPASRRSVDERYDTASMMSSENSFPDWESIRTGPSGPPSSKGRSSDAGESERLRVADIIRKLTSANQTQGCLTSSWNDEPVLSAAALPQIRTVLDQPEQMRGFSQVISSPMIRGRQAFSDLLMQMERDRNGELEGLAERRAVSRFSQRGRIQALLRLRFLRREMTAGDHQSSNSGAFARNRPTQGSAITLLRERFNTGVGHDATNVKSLHGEAVNNTVNIENSSTSNQLREDIHHPEVNNSEKQSTSQVQNSVSYIAEELCEKASTSSNMTRKGTDSDINNLSLQESRDKATFSNYCEENVNAAKQETNNNQELVGIDHYWISDIPQPQSDREEEQEASRQLLEVADHDQRSDISHSHGDWEEQLLEVADHDQRSDMFHSHGDWEEEDLNNQQLTVADHGRRSDVYNPQSDWEEHVANDPQSNWKEHVANDLQLVQTNHDWISDISRPRSDWEGLRQERYQDMLDPYSDNEEIRKLLERRSVSTFLSSNLRETMDQLMMSRIQSQPHPMGGQQEEEEGLRERMDQLVMSSVQRQMHQMCSQTEEEEELEEEEEEEEEEKEEEEEEEDEEGLRERMDRLVMSSVQRQMHQMCSQTEEEEEELEEEEEEEEEEEDEDYDDDDEEEEEEESPMGQQYNDVGHYYDQMTSSMRLPSPSLSRSWSHDCDHEVSDDSDQVASPSLQQPLSSQSSYHPSMEMELIYDLRGHMEQLHHEMSELRRAIKSCMNMQVNLQSSIKQEVAAAVNHSVRGVAKKPLNRAPRKGSCCICYEMEIDSLLYRCGHMCTCFECAHELQWSSGNCPICRAPILDIVRAYTHS